jgi:hypothetical protein
MPTAAALCYVGGPTPWRRRLEDLYGLMTSVEAASTLRLSDKRFKEICVDEGIKRWPNPYAWSTRKALQQRQAQAEVQEQVLALQGQLLQQQQQAAQVPALQGQLLQQQQQAAQVPALVQGQLQQQQQQQQQGPSGGR